MKTTMIAALVAAQLTAAACPAQAAGPPREEAAQPAPTGESRELALADAQTAASAQSDAARDHRPGKKERKSTGDKILTGAAVVLGVGALAVGGLLVAIFVN